MRVQFTKENIETLSIEVERSQIEWRKSKIAELDRKGGLKTKLVTNELYVFSQ